jgi:hypothetical protein
MLTQTRPHPVDEWDPMIVIASDGVTRHGTNLFRGGLRLLAGFFDALHRSRTRQAAQVIRRHQFLIDEARRREPRATIQGLPSIPSPSSWRD